MKIIFYMFITITFIFTFFLMWRYYDQLNWCRSEVTEKYEYTTKSNEKKYDKNLESSKLFKDIGIIERFIGANEVSALSNQPSFDNSLFGIYTTKYYTYRNGGKYESYEGAFDDCKLEWSNNLY